MSLAAFPRLAGALVAAVGATALLGWILDREDLRAFFFTPPVTVKTNTALGLIFAGAALFLLAPRARPALATAAGRALAALTLAIGVLTLSQHLFGWELGIDELLFEEAPGALATISPNRTGPPASITFTLIGLALLVLDARGRSAQGVRQTAAFAALLVALLGAIGYATGVSPLYAVARATGIALVSAIAFLLLGAGVAFARPDHGLVALLVRPDEAGAMARRLMIPSVVLPFAAAVTLARGVHAGWIDDRFATAFMALILIVALTVVIAKATADLARALRARDLAEAERAGREEALRGVNQRQREFLAVLSHELRNPLAPMRYALEMDRGWEDPGGPREIIRRQLGHLVRLVDDLLDVTRIATGKFQLRRRVIALDAVFDQAVEAARMEMGRGGHRLEVRPATPAAWLEADFDRMVQVVTNLLTNAARYSPPGSAIVLAGEADGEAAVIRVVDNGRGLDPGDLERVFEMFRQIGPGAGGLGLGLSLARTIVGLHGGTIEARSEGPGRGAEFIVRLKRTEASPDAAADPAPPPRRAGKKVVVADDNQDSAEMMKALLEIDGHEVEVAFDGLAAAALIARFAPDAAVLDIGMPGIDGYEVARRVRASGGAAVYLVAVTGWGQESDRKRAHEAGFDVHLTKPANPDEIRRLLGAR
jgi:signal transduction histidine kinase